jgi:hypothetical protein
MTTNPTMRKKMPELKGTVDASMLRCSTKPSSGSRSLLIKERHTKVSYQKLYINLHHPRHHDPTAFVPLFGKEGLGEIF